MELPGGTPQEEVPVLGDSVCSLDKPIVAHAPLPLVRGSCVRVVISFIFLLVCCLISTRYFLCKTCQPQLLWDFYLLDIACFIVSSLPASPQVVS